MKKIFFKTIYPVAAILIASTMQSCDTEELTDLNKNPNVIEYVIPSYSFTQAVLLSIPGQNYRALGQGLQYFASYKEVPAVGDKFYNFNGTAGSFNVYNNGTDNINNTPNAPGYGQWNRTNTIKAAVPGSENVNIRAACDILRILAFHAQTDVIGDMPYSEAMQGNDNLKPKYDTQKSIYMAMLTELDAALTSMDPSKLNVFGAADPYYKGDVVRWKKLGYTLMLRLGMRMSDVEPATAKTWSEKSHSRWGDGHF